MQQKEFLERFEKQLQGTITPEEEISLSQWFEQQQQEGVSAWDVQLLGDQEQVAQESYAQIMEKHKKRLGLQRSKLWLKVAASILLIASLSTIFIKYNIERTAVPETFVYQTDSAGYGQVVKVTLPDSSRIWLNAGSRIRYLKGFTAHKREIQLQGEAFFEVNHQPRRPFIVHSGRLNTQVLGTSFNVKAYADDPHIQVTVHTGKVGIYTQHHQSKKNGETVFLSPNQTASFNIANEVIKTETSKSEEEIAWRKGKLVYKNELLVAAIRDLKHKYGVDINLAKSMESCRVYGTFEHDAVEKILEMMAFSVNGKLIKAGKGYQILGKGCN
jgi:transmembrane sensor